MSSAARYVLLLLALGLCGSTWVIQAQVDRPEINRPSPEDRSVLGSIRGRILLPGGNFVSTNVKITLQTLRETMATIYTDNQGQFEFDGLLPGNYLLEIDPTDRQQFDVSTESVQVFKGMPSLVTPTLKTKESTSTRSPARTVSVSELAREVPANARKEFEKASKAAQKGQTDEAIAHLRKAIELYPDFVMARNDLGVQLLGQGKVNESAQELRTAVNLDPKSFNPALNLGIVLVHQHQFEEAAAILSKALSLDPNSPAAHLYSGIATMALGNLETAEKDLKAAYQLGGAHFALALFHLGQLYMNTGNRELALQSFERYLNDEPNAVNADQVRKMIALLR